MPTKTKTTDRLMRLRNLIDDTPTKEEIIEIVNAVVAALQVIDKKFSDTMEMLKNDTHSSLAEMKGMVNDVFVGEQMKRMRSDVDGAIERLNGRMAMIRDGKDGMMGMRGETGRDGKPGKHADETVVVARVTDALKNLFDEEFKKLREEMGTKSSLKFGGGGASAAGVKFAFGRIAKNETPSGAINGSNTTYTTTQPIHAVLSLVINGQFITDNEYTVSGRTITMTTALPAALSGLSFRISYI